ncbi:transcriptional regulator [Pyrococcus furiosus DSM 3638]|uniref:Transcriptional regulator n=3 Tax=Pyrococcus furiosus TaxID=2261 RepID=A0A5C0XQ60_PYRFU|nr:MULTISPECIES: ArsR family transcriptional regulator [Pyrococcus]AAL80356.1 transcription regulatory protein, arsR family [Pyrococcus furiosus DSM 3638]AFN03018.1 ArsR family transcriptional regulator [Pyrococcus furiosus COM1]MDK2869239.1 hypothetical protein [Pyrococcus sp.]QEK77954.1 transcriptional regulator [Pyrococcus furiosus DSM 3638]
MCRKDVMIISDPKQIKALSDPTRVKILELLRYHPMTVSEISRVIGKDKSTIYRHIKALEEAGLVEEVEKIGNETVYGRTALIFLVRIGSGLGEEMERFKKAYFMQSSEKLAKALEESGIKIKDRNKFVEILEEVFTSIDSESEEIISKLSSLNIDEVTFIHLLNFIVFLYSPKHVEKAKLLRELLDI